MIFLRSIKVMSWLPRQREIRARQTYSEKVAKTMCKVRNKALKEPA